jgi:excisionase family DNA binding protein
MGHVAISEPFCLKPATRPASIFSAGARASTTLKPTLKKLRCCIEVSETLMRKPGSSDVTTTVRRNGPPTDPFSQTRVSYAKLQAMDRLLTAEEIAERLGMKTQWVWAQARAGRIPHVRLGRYRRFRESAVEAWLRNLEADSTTPASTAPPSPVPLRRRA